MVASGRMRSRAPRSFPCPVWCGRRPKTRFCRKYHVLEPLDAVLHRRGVGTQHVQAGTVGHDIDLHVLVLLAVIFDHVGGVVEREIHHLGSFWSTWIAMRCSLGRRQARSWRRRWKARRRSETTKHNQTPKLGYSLVIASGAKQSILRAGRNGLLAPCFVASLARNDGE